MFNTKNRILYWLCVVVDSFSPACEQYSDSGKCSGSKQRSWRC